MASNYSPARKKVRGWKRKNTTARVFAEVLRDAILYGSGRVHVSSHDGRPVVRRVDHVPGATDGE